MTLDTLVTQAPKHLSTQAFGYVNAGHVQWISDVNSNLLVASVGATDPATASITLKSAASAPTTIETVAVGCTCKKGHIRQPCVHIIAVAIAYLDALMGIEPGRGGAPTAYVVEEIDFEIRDPEGQATPERIAQIKSDHKKLQQFLSSLSFDSEAEMLAFLERLKGKTTDEILAEYGEE